MYNDVRVPAAALFAVLLSTSAALAPSATAKADATSIGSKPRDYSRVPSSALRPGTVAPTASSAGGDRKLVQPGLVGAASVTTTGTITNVPISTELYDQLSPLMIPDGGGGGIAVWCDLRGGGTSRDLYAQKLNGGGVAQWALNGVPVCKASGSQDSARAVSDGAGGALVVWQDSRGSSIDIYAQRINSMGINLWQGGGLPVCTAANAQRQPVVVSDGQGGAVVAWVDERVGGSDVYVQRISAGGVAQWTADGVALCTASGVQQNPVIVTDGQRGAIVGWQDQRGAAGDIYAQRANESGAPQWTADGVVVCTATGTQETPVAVSDGAGGAILGWVDGRGANKDVYAQRVNGSGVAQWTVDGVGVCAASGDQVTPVLSADGEGGVVVTWQDGRGVDQDVYAQRVSNAGAVQWTADGVGVCAAVGDQTVPAIAGDPLGGAVVAWSDLRTGGNGTDIYAQHVNLAGAVQWTANGVQVCDALNAQDGAVVVSDGLGGAGVAWRDVRSGTFSDVYGQWVDASGQVANQCTTPDTLLSSVPAATVAPQNYKYFNQGWFRWSGVGVSGSSGDWDIEVFDQGSHGQSPYPTCFGVPLAGSFGTSTVDFVVGDFNDLQTPPGLYGVRAYRYSGTGGAVMEWEGGPEIIAVDGSGVTSEANWTGLLDVWDVQLTAGINYWIELNHSPSADIKVLVFTSFGSPDYYYVVPRSSRVAEGGGRYLTYLAPATDRYGLVVVNDNGVADTYTLKVWSTSQGVGVEPPRVLSTGLRGVSPNPSAGKVQIQFALHEPGAASFDVVDMAGRKVAQIPGRRWEAGTWSVEWDGRTSRGTQAAPGIYFVQMRVDERRVGLGRIALIR